MNRNRQTGNRQSGFSLIEMMVVVLILGIISAGLFAQIDGAQQRAFSEQIKLDTFPWPRRWPRDCSSTAGCSGSPPSVWAARAGT